MTRSLQQHEQVGMTLTQEPMPAKAGQLIKNPRTRVVTPFPKLPENQGIGELSDAFLKDYSPSGLLKQICAYRRGHESIGEVKFLKDWFEPELQKLEVDFATDGFGNYYVKIPGPETNRVLHVGHLDTVHHEFTKSVFQKVTVDEDNFLTLDFAHYEKKGNDNLPACLGADDGCAIAIMLYLIAHRISGTYFFPRGEEVGCLGTKYVIDNHPEFFKPYEIALEVDRADTHELIVEQTTGKCASAAFAEDLAAELGMGHETSFEGVYTDVGHLYDLVNESINIAAGYMSQHGNSEIADLTYLDTLGKQMLEVNYSVLSVSREVGDIRSENPNAGRYGWYDDWALGGMDDLDIPYGSGTRRSRGKACEGVGDSTEEVLAFAGHCDDDYLTMSGLSVEFQADLDRYGSRAECFDVLTWKERRKILAREGVTYLSDESLADLDIADVVDLVEQYSHQIAQYLIEQDLTAKDIGIEDFDWIEDYLYRNI